MLCWGNSLGWFMPFGWIMVAVFLVGLVALGAWGIATLVKHSNS